MSFFTTVIVTLPTVVLAAHATTLWIVLAALNKACFGLELATMATNVLAPDSTRPVLMALVTDEACKRRQRLLTARSDGTSTTTNKYIGTDSLPIYSALVDVGFDGWANHPAYRTIPDTDDGCYCGSDGSYLGLGELVSEIIMADWRVHNVTTQVIVVDQPLRVAGGTTV